MALPQSQDYLPLNIACGSFMAESIQQATAMLSRSDTHIFSGQA